MLENSDTLFARLRAACAEEWHAYSHHEFVRQLGDGGLPGPCFQHYLEQDYLFLIHFSRAWALAVYKAESLDDMRAAADTLNAILNTEMQLHVKYCEGFGLSEAAMAAKPEARANMAYTRYVLERGLAGDVLDLHVALAPCVIGYAEIGARLALENADTLEQNPYCEWIEAYAGEEYQRLAEAAVVQLDRLARSRLGSDRFVSLAKTFRQATTLEADFWTMGLELRG